MIRTYTELSKLKTFEERLEYLKLDNSVGWQTFGGHRWINQQFYNSPEWRRIRRKVILRDKACDLGLDGYELNSHIVIHHMNPLLLDDLVDRTDYLLNPEYLICCSHQTHNLIHYGNIKGTIKPIADRFPDDQCPWRT